jgi:protein-S-isoprenylcysteine O-methyltransferase Ste14
MDFPLLVTATTIAVYWCTVTLFAFYRRLLHGHNAGFFPKQRFERRLWWAFVPVLGGWIVLPWLGIDPTTPGLAVPDWAAAIPAVVFLRWAAAGIVVGCYILSLWCWARMGRNWTMAVVPKQETRLVTAGPYRWVRHPIYALSMLLMLATFVVLPTVPMAMVATLHLAALWLKAHNEEGHLLERFGSEYARYCAEVGRFCPSFTRRARP